MSEVTKPTTPHSRVKRPNDAVLHDKAAAGFTPNQIAEAFGVWPETVRTWLRRLGYEPQKDGRWAIRPSTTQRQPEAKPTEPPPSPLKRIRSEIGNVSLPAISMHIAYRNSLEDGAAPSSKHKHQAKKAVS